MKELEQLLKAHDFYFEYSDDHQVYLSGLAERKEISEKIKQLGTSKELEELLDKYKLKT